MQVDEHINSENDPIVLLVKEYMKRESVSKILEIIQRLISELYRIGAVGVKVSSTERFMYSYKDVPIVDPVSIDIDAKIVIHPMLNRALNIQD